MAEIKFARLEEERLRPEKTCEELNNAIEMLEKTDENRSKTFHHCKRGNLFPIEIVTHNFSIYNKKHYQRMMKCIE